MYSHTCCCFLLLCALFSLIKCYGPLVKIKQGLLMGKYSSTRGGRKISAFLGIPYAEPPLRFESPRPAKPWGDTVLNATKVGSKCVQIGSSPGSEDCLYLNIFTPNINPLRKYAVLVFIHGGSFESGSGDPQLLGPDYLLDEDIILVTLNYRLGLLGFLSLETPDLPGNLGLKDQRQALRWIKDNIDHFGGDRSKVTIFGESAGAASVSFHLIFTAKEGLFRAGMLSSKSALSISSFQHPGSQRHVVEVIIRETKCPQDPPALVECLKQLPVEEFSRLLTVIKQGPLPPLKSVTVLSPMIEPDSVADRLVTSAPMTTTTSLPILMGNNEKEGIYLLVDMEIDKTDQLFQAFNDSYETLLPYYLQFQDTAKDPKQISDSLKNFYLSDNSIDRANYLSLVDMYSDAHYTYCQVLAARANKDKTFFYQLNYRGANTLVHYLGSKEYYGVSHVDDLFYLFPMGGPSFRNVTDADTEFSKKIVKMWTNFVKYLDPTPNGFPVKWGSVKTSDIQFLNIGQTSFSMDSNYLKDRISFWDNLPYRNKPISDSHEQPSC